MRALKRQTIDTLLQDAPAGRKVLYIWERSGIYFIYRVKDALYPPIK